MTNQKNLFNLRIINAVLFFVIIIIQYSDIVSIKLFAANPMLPLSLLVAVCLFCSELTGAIAGLMAGIFVDTMASTPPGFNAIIFMLLGPACVLVAKHLFNNNILSSIVLCFLCAQIYYTVRWIICIAFYSSFAENLTYIFQTVFPSCLYTAILVVPFYFIEKYLYKKFYK